MKYNNNVHDVSAYIIEWHRKNFKFIGNLRLQKVLFFCQGFLSKDKKHLLIDAEFEAWQYGPVVREVYNHYKYIRLGALFNSGIIKGNLDNVDEETGKMIDEVLRSLSKHGDFTLVDISHEFSCWEKAFNRFYNKSMDINDILQDFKIRIEKAKQMEQETENES